MATFIFYSSEFIATKYSGMERKLPQNLANIALFETAERSPEAATLYYDGSSFTYATVAGAAKSVARLLLSKGAGPGQTVIIALDDSPAFVAAFFAILSIGAIAVPLPRAMWSSDLSSTIEVLDAAVAFVGPGTDPGLGLQTVEIDLALHDVEASGTGDFSDLYQPTEDDIAYVLLTSGSTGTPEGMPHRHEDFLHCYEAMKHALEYQPDDVVMCAPKLPFGYALGCNLIFPFIVGAAAILIREIPDDASLLKAALTYRPTLFVGQPRNLVGMIRNSDALSQVPLRTAIVAGETLTPTVSRRWAEQFPDTPLLDGYGMTEASGIFLCNTRSHSKEGSLGKPLPGYSTKLTQPVDEIAETDAVGELWVSGPSVITEYWRDPVTTTDKIVDGWVRTGDLFRRDDEGFHFILGRIDDMIKVGCGAWIAPATLEEVLMRHPAIGECAGFAFTDVDGVLRLKACVIPVVGQRPTRSLQHQLMHALEDAYPDEPSKRLETIEFVSDLPRSHTGKIDRRALGHHTQTEFSYQC